MILDVRGDQLEDALVTKHTLTQQGALLLGRIVGLGGDGRIGR